MKLMIASDIHGSAFYCEQMIEAYKREGADKLLLLGDILYHGPRGRGPMRGRCRVSANLKLTTFANASRRMR